MQLTAHDVVLVTGAASGLGEATVRALLAGPAAAVIVNLPSSCGAALATELGTGSCSPPPTSATRRRCRPRSTRPRP